MNLSLLLLFFLLMTGWAGPSNKVERAQLGHEFKLKVGGQSLIKEAGLKISFSAVVEDSRCPKGVDCIWAGNGKIMLKVSVGGGKATPLELSTNLEPRQASFHGYTIKLLSLDPYPQKDVPIKRGAYAVTLLVSR
jgi:hypothetical protein